MYDSMIKAIKRTDELTKKMLQTSVALRKIYLRDTVESIPPKLTIVFLIGYVILKIREYFGRKKNFV